MSADSAVHDFCSGHNTSDIVITSCIIGVCRMRFLQVLNPGKSNLNVELWYWLMRLDRTDHATTTATKHLG